MFTLLTWALISLRVEGGRESEGEFLVSLLTESQGFDAIKSRQQHCAMQLTICYHHY